MLPTATGASTAPTPPRRTVNGPRPTNDSRTRLACGVHGPSARYVAIPANAPGLSPATSAGPRPSTKTGGVWYVKRTAENWEPCPDGTAAAGLQVFRFAPTTPDGAKIDPTSPTLVGEDQTTGPSGACGISKPLFINMPFKLVKVG